MLTHPEDNFDDFWKVAAKVTPSTSMQGRPQSPNAPPPSSASMVNRPPSADPAGPSDKEGAYNVRSVPARIYLPDGPVIQDLVPPMLEDGMCPLQCPCSDLAYAVSRKSANPRRLPLDKITLALPATTAATAALAH